MHLSIGVHALNVVNSLGQTTKMVFCAQMNAERLETEETPLKIGERIRTSENKQRNVNIVGNNSQRIEIIRGIVQKNVIVEEENTK